MPVIACKLPAGLTIRHKGAKLTLAGSNIGEDLENVSRNGRPGDNPRRAHGYGLTEVSEDDAKVFAEWSDAVTFKNGVRSDGKLAEPFPALENGSILGPFKTIDEARKECASLATAVSTGFEGLDPEKEGTKDVEITDAEGKTSRRK